MPLRQEAEEQYPKIEEFSEKQLIAFEKETVGFYISCHPLARYQEAIRRATKEDTSTLIGLENGAEVKIGGLVSSVKEITTKKGDRMAFLTIEDMKGFTEVILFPEVFKAALPLLGSGDPVLIRGILDLSEEHFKIKAVEVQALSESPSSIRKTFHVRIPVSILTPSHLNDFKEIVTAHPGIYQILLHLMNGKGAETVVAFSDRYGVDPSPRFQNDIRNLFQSPLVTFE